MTNFCPRCGRPVADDWKLCPDCRTPLLEKCPRCGKFQRVNWTSCPYCQRRDAAAAGDNPPSSDTPLVCPDCGKPVREDWRVCPYCRAPLVEVIGYYCSECGRNVQKDWKVCPQCGERLDDEGGTGNAPPR
ncbi:MAG: zinc-ribbon domain-containing protein [Chloroflexi bacterium]|nr:zinc-ribbon domain-containing protein [Chloroflexota bacterium]